VIAMGTQEQEQSTFGTLYHELCAYSVGRLAFRLCNECFLCKMEKANACVDWQILSRFSSRATLSDDLLLGRGRRELAVLSLCDVLALVQPRRKTCSDDEVAVDSHCNLPRLRDVLAHTHNQENVISH